uniref:Peptidase S1 domain-containing protein n=1 Tax=Anopheles epiroticus TaxID=199890 RepID=A0A182PHH6_9DIPT
MQMYRAVCSILVMSVVGTLSVNNDHPLLLEIQEHQEVPHLLVRYKEESNALSSHGYDVLPGQFPYHALLNVKNDVEAATTLASGALITPNYVLTLAQTFHSIIVRYGSAYGYAELGYRYRSDRERQQQAEFKHAGILMHPQYTGGLLNNIATVRLERPVTLNRYVQPIRLPRLSDARTYEAMEGTAVGSMYNGTLRYLRNEVISNGQCQELHPHAFINGQQLCTNAYIGGAFCNRLYGAGLMVEDENGPILIGLTSLIYSCSLNHPILYVRVSEFRDWIGSNSNYVYDS